MDSKIQIFDLRNNDLLLETKAYLSDFIVKHSIKYLGLSNGNNASGMYYARGYPIPIKWGVQNNENTCGPEVEADCPTHLPCCSRQGFTDKHQLIRKSHKLCKGEYRSKVMPDVSHL